MQKIWQIKPRTKQNLIDQLLENRGLTDELAVKGFLNVSYDQLHDPFLFGEMRKAAERILVAIQKGQKILIYSDYDADAVTANAVVFRMIQALGVQPEVYIPDRFTEGYGLNLQAFENIKQQGINVVITVDCGTNSVAEAEYCRNNGIDLIITDHHEVTGELPQAYALINPKKPGETYPYHEVTGVGVAFKLACALMALRKEYGLGSDNLPDGYEKWLLDLVAIGTVADCHSLLGENRILVKFGLKVMQKTKWVGLRHLMDISGLSQRPLLDAYAIGFIIAPRINAAGRIDHAKIAFDLLATDDPAKALRLAHELEALNTKRQSLTEQVMSEARSQLALLDDRKVLLAVGDNWPKGVVGLVAGKLAEEFFKPVFILEKGDAECTGSARSVPNFNVVHALNHSREVLVKYGGHAAAAGLTLKNEHLDVFYKKLLDFAETSLSEGDLVKVVDIDCELSPEEIHLGHAELMQKFEPFGVDNLKPKFVVSGAEILNVNAVGKDQKHLQLTVAAKSASGVLKHLKCIAFNFGKHVANLAIGEKIDIAFELLCDEWNGNKNVKLRIIDYRKSA